jgi:hypothetical protein
MIAPIPAISPQAVYAKYGLALSVACLATLSGSALLVAWELHPCPADLDLDWLDAG